MYNWLHTFYPLNDSVPFLQREMAVVCNASHAVLSMGRFETTGSDSVHIRFSHDLTDHCAQSIFWVDLMEAVAVDEHGTKLFYPPLHVHHAHLFGTTKPTLEDFYDHTAEYLCSGETCAMDDLRPYTINLSNTIDSLDQIDDVRPRGSPPMTWYFQFRLRFSPYANHVSRVICYNHYSRAYAAKQGELTVIPVPTEFETFSAYNFHTFHDGQFVPRLTRFHSHHIFALETFLFRNTKFTHTGCLPTRTKRTAFSNNANLSAFLKSIRPLCHADLGVSWSRTMWIDSNPVMNCREAYIHSRDVLTSITIWGRPPQYSSLEYPEYVNEHHAWMLYMKENATTPHYDPTYPTGDDDCEQTP